LVEGLLSDAEWTCLEPFVIERGVRGGRRPRNHRLVLDGIFWIARTEVAWRDLHGDFGNWASVYRQFRRWTVSDLWGRVLRALNDGGDDSFSLLTIYGRIRIYPCPAVVRQDLCVRIFAVEQVALRLVHQRRSGIRQ
jgi:transposase